MPIYPLILPVTYRDQGFFNVTVEYDEYVRPDEGPVELVLVADGTEARLDARVTRSAQTNKTARIIGGSALRRWLQQHFQVGDRVDVDIQLPHRIRIVAPAE